MGQKSAHTCLIPPWYTPSDRPVKECFRREALARYKFRGAMARRAGRERNRPGQVAGEICFLLDFPPFYGGTEWNSTS